MKRVLVPDTKLASPEEWNIFLRLCWVWPSTTGSPTCGGGGAGAVWPMFLKKNVLLGLLSRLLLAFLAVPSVALAPKETMVDSSGLFQRTKKLKGFFVGSGSDGLSEPSMVHRILRLTNKDPSDTNVLFLGTAVYDLPGPQKRQTSRFAEAGCKISTLKVVSAAPSRKEMTAAMEGADVILVSGGNTLYAVDRWTRLGLHDIMRQAMLRGSVLTGGSAGAICWFQGGHSDSADPDTYKSAMLSVSDRGGDESSSAPTGTEDTKPWEYIRVEGLGFFPGLICPHHDKTQSNGVLRAADFDSMLLRHPAERGIGIDHWAALELSGGDFRVVAAQGKAGSVLPDDKFSPERKGVPGIWLKEVRDGKVHRVLCPKEGKVEDLLRAPPFVTTDDRVEICRKENPDDGPPPSDD